VVRQSVVFNRKYDGAGVFDSEYSSVDDTRGGGGGGIFCFISQYYIIAHIIAHNVCVMYVMTSVNYKFIVLISNTLGREGDRNKERENC